MYSHRGIQCIRNAFIVFCTRQCTQLLVAWHKNSLYKPCILLYTYSLTDRLFGFIQSFGVIENPWVVKGTFQGHKWVCSEDRE